MIVTEDKSFSIETSREKLNTFLASRDISPIRHTLSTSWDEASTRTQRYYTRKASQVVRACLEEIAPEQSGTLLNTLCDKSNFELTGIDYSLMDSLRECYYNGSHWSIRRQILSIMADKLSYRELLKWIPDLTPYRFNVARHHILLHGRGAALSSTRNTRTYVSHEKVEHFLTFITSTHIIQDLPFGEKTLKLSSGEQLKIPNVVRSLIPEQIMRQYQGYCRDVEFDPASRSTLLRILNVCSASTRKSLQGLDYFSITGAKAFDELEVIVEKIGDEHGKGLTWAKETTEKLKQAKRYLKGDYKVRTLTCNIHCTVNRISGLRFQILQFCDPFLHSFRLREYFGHRGTS